MKTHSIRSIPAAASMVAVLLLGVQAHAQAPGATLAPPPGSSNKLDAPMPSPQGGVPKRTGAQADSASLAPGKTTSMESAGPAPMGGKAKSAEERTAAKMARDEKDPAKAAKRAKRKAPADDASLTKPGSTQ
jgi:hypothetical protein